MRPIVSLNHATGLVLMLYAVGVMATPNGGAMGFLHEQTGISAPAAAVLFAVCGLYVFICKPNPAVFAVLTAPILLYSIASLGFLLTPRGGSMTAFFAHISIWLVANAANAEKARMWTQ